MKLGRWGVTMGLVVAALAGCGGGATSAEQGAGAGTGGGEAAGGTSVAWDDMTDEQKGQYMTDVVMPEMRRLFQEHDAEEYAEFSCATCHGANAREVEFEMPNGLAPLDPAAVPGMFQSEHPGAVFMTQRVWPRMAELLGEPLYDPQTHEGFSCFDCHATATAAEGAAHAD